MFADVKRMGHSQQARHRQREQAFLEQQQTTARNHRNDNITRLGAQMDERAQNKRWVQQQHAQQQELAMEQAMLEERALREAQAKKEAQETALAAELARQKTEKLRDEKMRQRVREESEEIRQLRSQLEAAYTNREREKQGMVAEKRKIYEQELDEEVKFIAETQRELEAHAESAKKIEQSKIVETERYKRELEAQVIAQKEAEEKAYIEYLKEKVIIDEVVRKIYEEDARAREVEMAKKQEQREYIQQFQREQALWQEQEKQRLAEETERIKKYQLQKEAEEAGRQTKRAEESAAKEHVQNQLAKQLESIRAQRDEYEDILRELALNEQEEKARLEEIAEMEKRINDRLELQRHRDLQMKLKEERLLAAVEEEEEYRRQMMEKFAEDDRIEQMNAQKRRMKQLEHKRAVEELIQHRREQHKREHEEELAEREREKAEARRRAEIIEEERQKLLAAHAKNVLGYLPKGVIRDGDDIARLGIAYADAYAPTTRRDFEAQYITDN